MVSTDGKGIPMTKKELAKTPTRRKRGEKAQKKKMATVATLYTVTEQDRFESVIKTDQLPDIAAHTKHIFAELEESGRIGAAHCWAAPSSEPTVRLSTQ